MTTYSTGYSNAYRVQVITTVGTYVPAVYNDTTGVTTGNYTPITFELRADANTGQGFAGWSCQGYLNVTYRSSTYGTYASTRVFTENTSTQRTITANGTGSTYSAGGYYTAYKATINCYHDSDGYLAFYATGNYGMVSTSPSYYMPVQTLNVGSSSAPIVISDQVIEARPVTTSLSRSGTTVTASHQTLQVATGASQSYTTYMSVDDITPTVATSVTAALTSKVTAYTVSGFDTLATGAVTTLYGVPSDPTNVSASRTARSVAVSYTSPTTNGGYYTVPTIYVFRNKKISGAWQGWVYHNDTDTLDLASEYKFGVQAANGTGSSNIVETGSIFIPAIPTTPTKVSLIRTSKKITFDWSDSVWDTNDTGNQYYQLQVTSSTDNANWNGWSDVSTTLSASTYTTPSDLTNGTFYKYQVKALSPTGVGDSSWLASGTMYIPSVPTTPTITSYGRSGRVITFDWSDSTWDSTTFSSDSGTNTYTLQVATSSDGTTWGNWTTLSSTGTASTYTSGTLNLATYYKYQVKANSNTGVGDSAYLTTSAIYISNASPAPVINTPLSKIVRKVTVDWNAIVPATGSTVTGYELDTRYSSDNGATWDTGWVNIASTGPSTTIFTTSDLNIAKTYQFRVRALTDVVASDYSDTTSLTIYNSIFISAYGYRFNGADWTTAIQNAWRYTGNNSDTITYNGAIYTGWVVVQSVQKNTSTGFTALQQ